MRPVGRLLSAISTAALTVRIIRALRRWGGSSPAGRLPTNPTTASSADGVERRRAATRFVIVVLLCVLVGSVASRFILSRSAPLSSPVISPVPQEVGDPTLYVSGAADPRVSILLSVSGVGEETIRADDDGRFQTVVMLPKGGDYIVTARARDDFGRSSPASQPLAVKYTPGWEPRGRIRKVSAIVSYRSVRIEVEEVASKQDQNSNLIKLVTGRELQGTPPTFEDYVSSEFSGFKFQGNSVATWLKNATPQFSIADKTVTVRASSRPLSDLSFISFKGLLKEELKISLPANAENDTYVFLVRDYDVESVSPLPPAAINNSIRAWSLNKVPPPTSTPTGGDQVPPPAASEITLKLAYRPFASPENLLKLSHLSLGDIVTSGLPAPEYLQEILKDLTRLLRSLLLALPLLWALCLAQEYPGVHQADPRRVAQFRWAVLSLLAVCFATPLLYLSQDDIEVAGELLFKTRLYRLLNTAFGPVSGPTFDLAAGVIKGIVFACVAAGLFYAAGLMTNMRRRAGLILCGLRMLSLGLLLASAATALIYVAASSFRLVLSSGYDQLFAEIVNAAVILYLFFVVFHMIRPRLLGLGPLVALFCLSCVVIFPFIDSPNLGGINRLIYAVRLFFATLQNVVPYIFFLLLLPTLRTPQTGAEIDRPIIYGLGFLIFASYVVGATANWLFIPIPFLLALWAFPRLVVRPREVWRQLDAEKDAVFSQRREQLIRLISPPSRWGRDAQEALEKKLVDGEVSREEYERKKPELEEYVAGEEKKDVSPGGVAWRELALNFGPNAANWENAKWSAKHGLILAVPFFFFYLWGIIQRELGLDKPYLLFFIVTRALIYFADWVIAAFFFGYFFPYLRGESGLKKGSYVGAAVIFCLLPVWIFAPTSALALLLRMGQTFLFFALLGLWAFDYSVLREELGERFDWKKLVQVEDLPSLTALASVALGSFGVTINSVLTGQFQTVFTQVVKLVFQQLPALEVLKQS